MSNFSTQISFSLQADSEFFDAHMSLYIIYSSSWLGALSGVSAQEVTFFKFL